MSSDLVSAKKKLHASLGEDMGKYYDLLKSWFKQKMTREDFDHEARKLLKSETVHLHNQFLLALLSKCQSLTSSLGRSHSVPASTAKAAVATSVTNHKPHKKVKVKRSSSYSIVEKVPVNQFLAVNPLVLAPQIPTQPPQEPGPEFCSRSLFLPDAAMLHGRLIVSAWEHALDDVSDDTVVVLQHAVQVALKNVLSAAFSRRSGYRLHEKRFKHSFSADIPVPAHIHQYEDTLCEEVDGGIVEESERERARSAAMLASRVGVPPPKHRLSLMDLYNALQVHKSALPCHSVHATNLQRICATMTHPSAEELPPQQTTQT